MLYFLSIVLISFLIGNSLILVFNGKRSSKLNKGIGLTLFLYGLVFLLFLLSFDVGLLREYPFLLKVVSPIFFLMPPIFYLSIRNIVRNTKITKKTDFIHFLPAIFHFLELIPLYTLSNQEKSEIIEKFFPDIFAFILNVQGLIPTLWVNLAYLTLLILYFSLTLGLVLKFPIELRDKLKQEKFKSILFTTLVFYFVFNIIIILSSISIVQFYFTGLDLVVLKGLFLKFSLVILFAYNFYFFHRIELTPDSQNREVLPYGEEEMIGSISLIDESRSPLDWSDTGLDREDVVSRINQLMEHEKVFLDEGLLLNDFAQKAKIPSRVFPDVLNLIFQKNFKQLILERRVHYAKEKIEQGYLNKLTLESLRSECGFGSRTAFYYAFKKEFELSPNEYWKEFQRSSNLIR
jgi:AraC-like DNA-binding protein